MTDNFDDFIKEMDLKIEKLLDLIEKQNKSEEVETINSLSNKNNLKIQLGHNDYVLETHRDLNAITYVTTLELIKKVLMDMQDKHKDKILRNSPYELILSEIEPALDDLTLDSLMLVVEQYKSISEISEGKIPSSEHIKVEKEIRTRHKEFQKVIKRG